MDRELNNSKSQDLAQRKKVITSKAHSTSNGQFRILCVPISDSCRVSLISAQYSFCKGIIEEKQELREFSKSVYVMRATGSSSSDVVSGRNEKEDKEEGKGFEGLGDLLLDQMARYRIDNVVICVAFLGHNIMKGVREKNFEVVCGRVKEFILELYSSLIEFQIISNDTADEFATHKHFDIPIPAHAVKSGQSRKKKEQVFEFKIPTIVKVTDL
jgi:hypothetical protein